MLNINSKFDKANIVKKTFFILFLILISTSAYAHKLNVFAFVEGDKVNVEGYFTDGILAKNAKVTVTDLAGDLLYEGRADEKGMHQFKTPGKSEMLIKIDAGLGHIATYQLGANEISEKVKTASTAESTAATMNTEELKQAIAEAVKPLAREISELKSKSRMSDIVGGIGYILGILGLFAYLKFRKESQSGN